MNYSGYCSREQIIRIAYFLLEGNTVEEAAEEFNFSEKYVSSIVNGQMRHDYPEIYTKLKNKPYMVFQRIVYRKVNLEEARKIFNVSEKNFNKFLSDILKKDFKTYIIVRTKIYNSIPNK